MPRAVKNDVSAAELRSRLNYDAETGHFFSRRDGKQVGYVNSGGYVHVKIRGRGYLAHRLAYLWMTGRWPDHEIDHRNRDRADNRWANLRPANRSQNSHNAKPFRTELGVKGVRRSWSRYRAVIMRGGKSVHLGTFSTVDEAGEAYQRAARELYGEHAYE